MGILDLFFPKRCLGCGWTGAYFCSQCLNLITLDRERICPVCEKPAIGGQTHPRCQSRYTLDGLTSIFNYKGIIKKAITELKYHFVTDLAQDLTELFVSFCGENKTFRNICQKESLSLTSIPLHPRRENWRGFNQSELLGRMIAENLGVSFFPGFLKRERNTIPQTKFKEKERKVNIKDAFRINSALPFPLSTSSLLLFDDVWTTGATLKEAGKTLKQNGAEFVWGLTLAR